MASFVVVVSAASWFIYAAGARGTHAPSVLAAAAAILAAVTAWGVVYAPTRERQRAMMASAPRRSRL